MCPFLTNRRAVGGLAIEFIEQRRVLVAEDHEYALNSAGDLGVELLHRLLHGEDAEIVLAILVDRTIEAIEERRDVEEYCVSEGWIKVPAGKTLDRKGNPLLIKIKGTVEAFYK